MFNPACLDGPMVVNFGGGVDSTAILVGLARLYRMGDDTAKPDLILFADTGDELPETYENVRRVSEWCEATFGIPVTIASRPNNIPGRVGYKSLSENCITNETLPSEAFGRGACSLKWKHEPMDAFLHGRKRPLREGWLQAQGYEPGIKPLRLIGYDATETQKGKRKKNSEIGEDSTNFYRYPLVEWGWSREECERAIAVEGLPKVIKSACFMCPNQTEGELLTMANDNPKLFLRALAIEEIAKSGKHGLRFEGLWRRTRKSDGRPGSWFAWASQTVLDSGISVLATAELLAGYRLDELLHILKPELFAAPTK
tara:strand:+ start:2191 stop:3129 length:939 start_codon:yes stop_codon:yes gene_type:complete